MERLHSDGSASCDSLELRAVSIVAAGLAHEIRNPLTAMQTALGALEQEAQPGARELVEIVLEESRRLQRLVDRVLGVGRITPRLDLVRIDRLVARCLELAARDPRCDAGPRLTLRCEADQEPLLVDPDLLRQAIWNLLDNAIEAALPRGEVVIEIAPEERRGRPGTRIDVCDDGPGVDPAIRDTLWHPFASTRPAGTGLGLPWVQAIAELHGGSTHVVDRPTRIGIWIPREPPTMERKPAWREF